MHRAGLLDPPAAERTGIIHNATPTPRTGVVPPLEGVVSGGTSGHSAGG